MTNTTNTEFKTAEQRIAQAIAEKATITIDHETRSFVGLRFRLAAETRDTVVRVNRSMASRIIAA